MLEQLSWWVPKCRWSMACNLSHCLAHNNAISSAFPFLDHKSWLFSLAAAPESAFTGSFIFILFSTIMLALCRRRVTSQCRILHFFLPTSRSLIFHPESSPPTLQHISLCARCCWRLNIVSLNHVVTIWCDGCVQTNYSWWYWKPYKNGEMRKMAFA